MSTPDDMAKTVALVEKHGRRGRAVETDIRDTAAVNAARSAGWPSSAAPAHWCPTLAS